MACESSEWCQHNYPISIMDAIVADAISGMILRDDIKPQTP